MALENKIFESALHYAPALANSYELALILVFVLPNERPSKEVCSKVCARILIQPVPKFDLSSLVRLKPAA
jgi:hypothetical protein